MYDPVLITVVELIAWVNICFSGLGCIRVDYRGEGPEMALLVILKDGGAKKIELTPAKELSTDDIGRHLIGIRFAA